jgi:UDP-2,3-diacylglucosamine pyrophosphatase LpxH
MRAEMIDEHEVVLACIKIFIGKIITKGKRKVYDCKGNQDILLRNKRNQEKKRLEL